MPPSYFPLRWESTGDQWWYASPIDWAAANGLYDLVSELLHLDTNLLIKLTSLRRIRRLETVWDDEEQFHDVAKCRSQVARKLLHECETKKGHNSLIRAGYGGWFLYTAASAGDVDFVKELLERDPLLVFGEGEYGVTDLFYAAARSKNSEVFRLLLDSSISPKCFSGNGGGDLDGKVGEESSVFKWEMMNRAIHAAARGGNLEVLSEILGDCSNVLVYRDAQGSTVLHTASGRGQVEVVQYLAESHDITISTDNQGNSALHVAAYRGYLGVVELLVHQCPSLASLTNNYGDTFFHMAVAGFRTPGFRRLDRQIQLMENLVCGKLLDMEHIINATNNDGRTALHVAVADNIQSNVVELLMTVPSIDLNIRDAEGMTPLDLLKQRPKSASSEILIKQLISAGGISNCQDLKARNALVSHLKMQGIGTSPGTSFRVPDAEIYLYMDIDGASDIDAASIESCSCSGEITPFESPNDLSDSKKPGSVNYAAKQLRNLLRWPRGKEKKASQTELGGDDASSDLYMCSPIPLRERYSKSSALFPNKRNLPPSPSTKRSYAFGLMHGVINTTPHLAVASDQSPSTTRSRSAMSSPNGPVEPSSSNGKSQQMSYKYRQTSVNKKMMNQYFCFGAQGLAVEESIGTYTRPMQSFKRIGSLTA